MKVEIDNSGGHLRAMRDTMDSLRMWITAFHTGIASAGGGNWTPLKGFELHLGQIRMVLDALMRQVETAEEAKAKKK